MILLDLKGRPKNVPLAKYKIVWNGKSRSKVQFAVKQFFHTYWNNDIVAEEFKIPGTQMRCDIINFTKKIAIEVHGLFHESYNPFFHGKSKYTFLSGMRRDIAKEDWLEKNNFKLIIIYENEIKQLSPEWIKEKFDIKL